MPEKLFYTNGSFESVPSPITHSLNAEVPQQSSATPWQGVAGRQYIAFAVEDQSLVGSHPSQTHSAPVRPQGAGPNPSIPNSAPTQGSALPGSPVPGDVTPMAPKKVHTVIIWGTAAKPPEPPLCQQLGAQYRSALPHRGHKYPCWCSRGLE